jgi:hypothetical protein
VFISFLYIELLMLSIPPVIKDAFNTVIKQAEVIIAFSLFVLYIIISIYVFKDNWYGVNERGRKGPAIGITLFTGFVLLMSALFIWGRKQDGNRHGTDWINDKNKTLSGYLFRLSILFLGFFVVFLAIYFCIQVYISSETGLYAILHILIYVGAITLAYFLLRRLLVFNVASKSKLFKVLGAVLAYVPCMVHDLFNNIKLQLRITTSTEVLILITEVLLIALYFAAPIITKVIMYGNNKLLLQNPVYLNREHVIGKNKQLHRGLKDGEFRYEYAVSGWYYINPQPPNTGSAYSEFATLMNFGGKPEIAYRASTNTLIVRMMDGFKETRVIHSKSNNKNNRDTASKFNIPDKLKNINNVLYKKEDLELQKWHHIIVIYTGGTVDIFLNGEFVSSTNHVIPYMSYDELVVGQDNGIEGGVKNVIYFDKVLTKQDIYWLGKH